MAMAPGEIDHLPSVVRQIRDLIAGPVASTLACPTGRIASGKAVDRRPAPDAPRW